MVKTKRIYAWAITAIAAAGLMTALSFTGVPDITGQAINELASAKGIPAALISVIVIAILIGMSYYATLSAIPEELDAEKLYMRSKYWAGYAVQKVQWAAARKKTNREIKIELPAETKTVRPAQAAPPKPAKKAERAEEAEQTLFSSIMKGVKDVDFKTGELGQQTAEPRVRKEAAQKAPEKETIAEKKELTRPEPKKEAPQEEIKRHLQAERPAPRPAQKPAPAKTATEKPVQKIAPQKQPERPANRFSSRFGTEDPLKVAKMILRNDPSYNTAQNKKVKR